MQEEKIAPKLKLIENDPWLEPFSEAIEGRHEFVLKKEKELTNNGKSTKWLCRKWIGCSKKKIYKQKYCRGPPV